MAHKKEINYWPYAILGMILTVVVLGIWTIKVAVRHPVQESNAYMMKYQEVDANINEIIAAQKAFDARYVVDLSANRLRLGEGNRVKVKVSDRAGNSVGNARIIAVVQRPTTNRFNIELKDFNQTDGLYLSAPFAIEKPGRWNIEVKVTVGEYTGYKTYKSFVKP